jgi:hypothetical protein
MLSKTAAATYAKATAAEERRGYSAVAVPLCLPRRSPAKADRGVNFSPSRMCFHICSLLQLNG